MLYVHVHVHAYTCTCIFCSPGSPTFKGASLQLSATTARHLSIPLQCIFLEVHCFLENIHTICTDANCLTAYSTVVSCNSTENNLSEYMYVMLPGMPGLQIG